MKRFGIRRDVSFEIVKQRPDDVKRRLLKEINKLLNNNE